MKAVCFDIPLGAGNIAFVILFFQIVVNEINSQYNFILQSHFSKWHSKMELVLFFVFPSEIAKVFCSVSLKMRGSRHVS